MTENKARSTPQDATPQNVLSGPVDICNVCSRRFLAQGLTMIWSLRRLDPDYRFHIFLSDITSGEGANLSSAFPDVSFHFIDEYATPALLDNALMLTDLEFNVSLKAVALTNVLELGQGRALYCDSDLLFVESPKAACVTLSTHSVLLTPHHLEPTNAANQLSMLRHGAFNSGFVGASGKIGLRFAEWWLNVCEKYCLLEPEEGLFVDQKWLDLVPSLFKLVKVFQDPAYNIAYWNYRERRQPETEWTVLHLSGFNPASQVRIGAPLSKFDDSVTIDEAIAKVLAPYTKAYADIRRQVDDVVGLPADPTPFDRLAQTVAEPIAKRASVKRYRLSVEQKGPERRSRGPVDQVALPELHRRNVPVLQFTRWVGNGLVQLRLGRALEGAIALFRILGRRSSWLK